MGGRQRFSEHEQAQMIEDYMTGMSLENVGRKYGCCYDVVRKALIRRGIARRPTGCVQRVFTDAEREQMLSLWQEGWACARIARRVGTTPETTRRTLERMGVSVAFRGQTRHNHHLWQGGRYKSHGYIEVLVEPTDPMFVMVERGGRVKEHRLVMARTLGRPLTPDETVHHINGDRADNRPENLQLRHGKHGKGARYQCRDCGSFNVVAVDV